MAEQEITLKFYDTHYDIKKVKILLAIISLFAISSVVF
jgi:hypothetical protein